MDPFSIISSKKKKEKEKEKEKQKETVQTKSILDLSLSPSFSEAGGMFENSSTIVLS
jgi:hypothetical protein